MSIGILLADDHKIIRDGLRSLLAKQDDMEVIGEAEDGRTAVQLARDLSPMIVVMDIAMPDLNGVEATRQVLEINPGIKVVALSMSSDGPVVRRMFQAGAVGYLLKDCAFDELVEGASNGAGGSNLSEPRYCERPGSKHVFGRIGDGFTADGQGAGSAAVDCRGKEHEGSGTGAVGEREDD